MADPLALPEQTYTPSNRRRILCIFPAYSRSFGTLHHAYPLVRGVKAFMPPQGILLVAAFLPEAWEVRFIDENIGPATRADYLWADAVLVSGMHIQKPQMDRINGLAQGAGKVTVLGGPSVSAVPEDYPAFDILHLGELGDATLALIRHLDRDCRRPPQQLRFETVQRIPLDAFPVPSYRFINLEQYFLANIQYSSGCPYRCEFCDIPELYGRVPRHKSPEQIVAELDAMLARGNPGAVYFVDDNFASDLKSLGELLPCLVSWQRERGYPVQFACEATLNLALYPKILELMREAYFCTVYCGIESPSHEALHSVAKHQNLKLPILEAVGIFNEYGMEVVSGIIMGLDGEPPQIDREIDALIRLTNIPMLTINLLYALPRTPLWRRLEEEGRLLCDPGRESNVAFLAPYEEVVEKWRRCITQAYEPDFLYQRFAYQLENTYPQRIAVPNSPARVNLKNILKGLSLLASIVWQVGIRGDYRATFWRMARPALKRGDVEGLIHVGLVAHHLIQFARECDRGEESASFYSQKVKKVP